MERERLLESSHDPVSQLARASEVTDKHVIVIEDDRGMRLLIGRILREEGYRVTSCVSGGELWALDPNLTSDLVLLDRMLPGPSGLSILQAIRARSAVPVIILSARGEETDRVLGLELGADDYIPKPFSRAELLARVRAVLRRSTVAAASSGSRVDFFVFDGWHLDLRARTLIDPDGVLVDLSGAEFDLLVVFAQYPGQVLRRDKVSELTRGRYSGPFDRSIDTLVSRLRRKMTVGMVEAPIKTVRGSGYIMVAHVHGSENHIIRQPT